MSRKTNRDTRLTIRLSEPLRQALDDEARLAGLSVHSIVIGLLPSFQAASIGGILPFCRERSSQIISHQMADQFDGENRQRDENDQGIDITLGHAVEAEVIMALII
jgi:hypothetical protein